MLRKGYDASMAVMTYESCPQEVLVTASARIPAGNSTKIISALYISFIYARY